MSPQPTLKPPTLRPGANLAVISPAGSPNPDRVHAGIAQLQRLGYRTTLGLHTLLAGPLYYAGSLEQRLADLVWAFTDPTVDAVLCTRGGWGSAELLPHLDPALFRQHPKPFIGFSDITSLQIWLAREAGLVTFYGPMVSADFARPDGVDLPSWKAALTSTAPWSLNSAAGLRTLRAGSCGRSATGVLRGGCLALLTESLGTPFAPLPATPDQPAILFLEDINVKPYQWDRMLLHLRLAGQLDHVTGIVLGDMTQCAPAADHAFLEAAILHALHDFPGPVAIGLPSGHVDGPNLTLPLGIPVTLDCSDPANPQLHFAESATTP